MNELLEKIREYQQKKQIPVFREYFHFKFLSQIPGFPEPGSLERFAEANKLKLHGRENDMGYERGQPDYGDIIIFLPGEKPQGYDTVWKWVPLDADMNDLEFLKPGFSDWKDSIWQKKAQK